MLIASHPIKSISPWRRGQRKLRATIMSSSSSALPARQERQASGRRVSGSHEPGGRGTRQDPSECAYDGLVRQHGTSAAAPTFRRTAEVKMRITTCLPGGSFKLDRQDAGTAPQMLPMAPGKHVLEFSKSISQYQQSRGRLPTHRLAPLKWN